MAHIRRLYGFAAALLLAAGLVTLFGLPPTADGPSARRLAFQAKAPPTVSEALFSPVPVSKLPLRLVGTVADGHGTGGALIETTEEDGGTVTGLYEVDDEVMPGVEIVSIADGTVVLAHDGRNEALFRHNPTNVTSAGERAVNALQKAAFDARKLIGLPLPTVLRHVH